MLTPQIVIDVKDENGLRRYTAPGIANWVKKGGKTEDLINNADTYTQFIQGMLKQASKVVTSTKVAY